MMKIRSAELEDSRAIAVLAGQLGYPTSAEKVRSRIRDLIATEDHYVIICEGDRGEVLGWTHVHVVVSLYQDHVAELSGLVVDEEHRSQGVGRALLQEAERWSAENGCSLLRVRSNVIRTRAHQFYSQQGYVTLKTQKVFEKPLGR